MMNRIFGFLLVIFLTAVAGFAQDNGTIRGTVTSQTNNAPLAGVTVQITQLGRSVETNENGVYEFTNVTSGKYTLVTHTDGFSDQAQSVTVVGGTPSTIDFALSLTALREEVTVTATGSEESVFESFQSVNAVGGTRIREQASTSIGEVLERESGVGKRAFGPGAARPVIRGFDGDRVLVVQDGIRVGSLASQSGDHGEPIDSLNLERIEVLKGPATLLYGSNAIGGVVNAVSTDENQPHEGFRGNFTGLGATNNKQGGVSGGIEYGFGKSLFNANTNYIREGDYKTPFGEIPNSAARSYGSHASFGHYADKWFMAGSFNLDRRRYGVPYAPLFEEGVLLTDSDGEPCEPGEDISRGKGSDCQYDIFAIRERFSNRLPEIPEEAIDIKMRSNNFRLRGGFRDVGGAIPQGDFSINYTRYRHNEIETDAAGIDEIATTFTNNTFSYRGVFQQAKYGSLTGQFGFEGYTRDYLTVGAEQLIDGMVKQNNFSFFGLEELSFGRVALQFGGRVETNRFRPVNTALYSERDFTGFSGAAAARIGLWEGGSFIANFTSAYRSPSIEELYNNGAHIGTVTFEIGDQDLRRERSNGIELSLRHRTNRVRLSGSFFHYKIDNFVFLAPQDEDGNGNVDVEDNLPIGAYQQNDAKFTGADFTVDADIKKWLGAFFIADTVVAELQGGDTPLPRITPARIRIGLDLRYKGLSVRPEGTFVGARDIGDVFTLETPTAGYGLFNVNASYTYTKDRFAHIFSLGTSNLGNRLYRNHLSFIKDLAPEPGRGARFSYTLRFF